MESNPDLERFRQQWREEVTARSQQQQQHQKAPHPEPGTDETHIAHDSSTRHKVTKAARPPAHHPAADVRDDEIDDEEPDPAKDISAGLSNLNISTVDDDEFKPKPSHEPRSALEHYERAVEKEIEGKLGDSVSHYRQAYRLDARVDQEYKNKHFAAAWKGQSAGSSTSQSAPSQAMSAGKDTAVPLSFADLITSFAGAPIAGVDPIIKGDRAPPCPISKLPSEILHDIYLQAAIQDPALLSRIALVCKKFAWDIFTDISVWKRLALGPEFGVGSQKYDFACDLRGREIIDEVLGSADGEKEENLGPDIKELSENHKDWREFFHSHPRIRFNGVYISTVNYTRAGHGNATSAVWHTPIHIVTYYRYLRFFRDGTVISLLTTHEPTEVVHQLTRENMELMALHPKEHPVSHAGSGPSNVAGSAPAPHITPSAQALMKHALRGRWRLCHPTHEWTNKKIEEGDLHIETEGVGPRYIYTMHLSLKSASRSRTAVRNNKLQWKGFWSYNHLTNDWAEFQLKNDRAFVFSRVRSYGMGY